MNLQWCGLHIWKLLFCYMFFFVYFAQHKTLKKLTCVFWVYCNLCIVCHYVWMYGTNVLFLFLSCFFFFFFFYYTIQTQYASILKLNRIGFFVFSAICMKVCDGLFENTQSTICMLHIRIIEIPLNGVSIVSSVVWLTTQTRNCNKCQLQPPKNNIQNLFAIHSHLLSMCLLFLF